MNGPNLERAVDFQRASDSQPADGTLEKDVMTTTKPRHVNQHESSSSFDPVLLAVLANRFEAIVRDMSNTLLRAAYSPILSLGRDFSCSIVSADNELVACAEGCPIHIYGGHLQAESMTQLHDDLAPGDAFLHNDPYLGGTHPADHTILVPIFLDGCFSFTAVVKGHLADNGNAQPTTYMPQARDIYEEGGLIFPCVRVERNYEQNADIVRMCEKRIRSPKQWYGDFIAMVAAARVGERGIQELADKYGRDVLSRFVREWLAYSERRMTSAIKRLPTMQVTSQSQHDVFPGLPEGLALRMTINVDGNEGTIEVDLRDNIDCVDGGTNGSVACVMSAVMQGVMGSLDASVPRNAGSFRRVTALLRENCVVGIPRFPHSCSCATSNPADRLINMAYAAFAALPDEWGMAEGGLAHNAGYAIISGTDARHGDATYVNQILLGNNGGPGTPVSDGWLTYQVPGTSGLMYRDSVEVDEQKFPILVRRLGLLTDSGGAGKFRGASGTYVEFGSRFSPMHVEYPSDGFQNPPKGVRGGHAGSRARAWREDTNGERIALPNVYAATLQPGEWIISHDNGGGGYGNPLLRDPDLVARDVAEGWVSLDRARDVYGVVINRTGDGQLQLDSAATVGLRTELDDLSRDAAPSA